MEDGWSLPDEFIFSVAIKAQMSGVMTRVFYDGSVSQPKDFLAAMQNKTNYPVFGFHKGEPIGWAWLNGLAETHAQVHFCTLPSAGAKLALKGAKAALLYWFTAMPNLRVITGFTPANNLVAVKFIERVGFKRVGDIPNMLVDAYTGESVDAVLSYYERD